MSSGQAGRQQSGALAEILGNGAFLRVWAAGICAGTMRWLEVLAVGVYTLEVTGSAFMVALMFFARTVPTPLCGPLAGSLADRMPRRVLLLGGVAVMLLVSAVLAGLALTGTLALWQVACGAVLAGMVWSLEHTVRRTIVRDVVAPVRVGNAISLDTGTQNASRMLGPLFGGSLMALIGLEGAYGLAVVFYAVAFALIAGLRVALPVAVGERLPLLRSVTEGLRYVLSNRTLTAVLVVTVILNMFGFPYASMVPVIGRDTLHLSPGGIGVLMSAEGAGAIIGAFALAAGVRAVHYRRIFLAGAMTFLCAMAAFSLTRSFTAAAASLFVAGVGLGGFAAMQSTILLTLAAPHMRSRVMGLLVLTIGAGPFGVLALGALAERFGATTALGWTAATGSVLLVLTSVRWPSLLQRHS